MGATRKESELVTSISWITCISKKICHPKSLWQDAVVQSHGEAIISTRSGSYMEGYQLTPSPHLIHLISCQKILSSACNCLQSCRSSLRELVFWNIMKNQQLMVESDRGVRVEYFVCILAKTEEATTSVCHVWFYSEWNHPHPHKSLRSTQLRLSNCCQQIPPLASIAWILRPAEPATPTSPIPSPVEIIFLTPESQSLAKKIAARQQNLNVRPICAMITFIISSSPQEFGVNLARPKKFHILAKTHGSRKCHNSDACHEMPDNLNPLRKPSRADLTWLGNNQWGNIMKKVRNRKWIGTHKKRRLIYTYMFD